MGPQVIAKNYIDNLKEEVDKGMKEKLAQGWLPGTPPLGYKTIGEEGKKIHVIDPEVAPLVKKLFELYLDPSYSLSSVTAEMKRLGLRTRRGRPLVVSHITKMLKHQFYISKNPWMGQLYPGKQERLISDEVFWAVQRKMSGKNIPKQSKHNPTFKALFKCTDCGGTITWERQKGHWYGHCNRYRNCPKKVWAREDEVEEQLLMHFNNFTAPSPALVDWVKTELRKRHETDMESHYASQRQLKQRHEDLGRRIDIAYEDRLDGRLSVEKYDELVGKYTEEQNAIKSELNRYDETYLGRLEHGINVLELTQKAAEIYKTMDAPDQRRRLLVQIFSNLTLDGKTLDYEYTPAAAAIARVANETNKLRETFEPDDNGLPKAKEAFIEASKSIWLGR